MIKFFRNIRQKMLTENKFSKYLLYAIGEIALVVVGILIALQINNWNQNKTEKSVIMSILKEIREDLETDIEVFESNIAKYDDRITATIWGLSKTSYEQSPKDSIVEYLLTNYSDNKLSDYGFTKLQNSGIANFFALDSIVNQIRKFYSVKGKQFNIMVDWDTQYTTQDIIWLKNLEDSWEMTFVTSATNVLSTVREFPSLKNDEENLDEIINVVERSKFRNDKWDDLRRKKILKSLFIEMKAEASRIIVELETLDLNLK